MAITFGGLATGIDTDSIIDSLIELERQPIERLTLEKTYLTSRLAAFTSFDLQLKGLMAAAEELDTSEEVRSFKTTAASEEFFSVTSSSSAGIGSHQVEVVALARQQKMASDALGTDTGYSSKTSDLNLTGTFKINGKNSATISFAAGDSLTAIKDSINAANSGSNPTGVSATIINDGSTNGYRIVLSGEDPTSVFTVSDITGDDLGFVETQAAQAATIKVDGITITADSNTVTDAIPGITLTLLKENAADETTRLSVDIDSAATENKIKALVAAYNEITSFISSQSDSSWGSDPAFRTVKGRLQNLLVTSVGNTGNFQHLTDLGITTNYKTGMLEIDNDTLTAAIKDDLDSVEKLLAGEDGVDGITTLFKNYLEGITDSSNGVLASRQASTTSSNERIDDKIAQLETRVEMREKTLRAQFTALEELANVLNAQGSFLTQQMDMISNITTAGSK
jgi:flagellar hook-associated protein 2